MFKVLMLPRESCNVNRSHFAWHCSASLKAQGSGWQQQIGGQFLTGGDSKELLWAIIFGERNCSLRFHLLRYQCWRQIAVNTEYPCSVSVPTIRCDLFFGFTMLLREQHMHIACCKKRLLERQGYKIGHSLRKWKTYLSFSFLRRFVGRSELALGSCFMVRRLSRTNGEAPDMDRKSTFRTMDGCLGATFFFLFIFVCNVPRLLLTFVLAFWLCSKGR